MSKKKWRYRVEVQFFIECDPDSTYARIEKLTSKLPGAEITWVRRLSDEEWKKC